MSKFAFIFHPISVRDVSRKYPILRYVPDPIVSAAMRYKKPVLCSHITGLESKTGATAEGMFIACPLTPTQLTQMPLEQAYRKIIACVELAAQHGAEIVGLGAFTSVIGDGGITIARRSPVPVTTGNSYTVATAIQGTLDACDKVGLDLQSSCLAIVGATGAIGKTCAEMLAPRFQRTLLIGRDRDRTEQLAARIDKSEAMINLNSLREADVIVTVSSAEVAIIEPEHLKSGAVVCDVARPRDVSQRVMAVRSDVLVLEGGVVRVPGNVDFHFDFGFPRQTAYACMSETMLLALENRCQSYTVGKDVSIAQVNEMLELAEKHGFELAGYRSFERPVSQEAINRARRARRRSQPSFAH